MSGIHMALLGASSAGLDTLVVVTGTDGTAPNRNRGFSVGTYGTCTPTTSSIYGGADISALAWSESNGAPFYVFTVFGATNSGWTKLTIGSTVLNRVDAAFAFGIWTWTTTDTITTQAFGSSGDTIVCTFT